ncbi:epimerase family protein SDR39U1 isoform X3 [Narcine bancroftii]|uniref:epimerase family protein SDR39U1 isoform X3 n=1 Tax=Narcine bancroftii TaxID=1343680 RepID=UPI003831C741
MRVLIGGGSGFVGGALTHLLRSKGHEVQHVSRDPRAGVTWAQLVSKGLPTCDAVVNVAGANVLSPLRRWDAEYEAEVQSSRLETTRTLRDAIIRARSPPHAWVLLTGVGVVLGKNGGALKWMLWPFRLGLGGSLGSGRQPFPWIHVDDLSGILLHAMEGSTVHGILNGVAPCLSTNAEFVGTLARCLGRPALLPVPGGVLQALLGPQRASMLLEGQWVVPQRTLESGYRYHFPQLAAALKDLVS